MAQGTAARSAGGLLQIPASATQKDASSPSRRKSAKPASPRLKLLVRRLPPGLTATEFENALGQDWKVGAGKVDWLEYKPGKVSKDPAKPSRPSRAYVRVFSTEHIALLSDKIRQTSFMDGRNTYNDPVLLGPPTLEFAPFAKIPGNRVRKDARQGTIDQDPEFIAFLESLTQPITKTNPGEAPADGDEKNGAVTITPLVQYIKEKKANKAKESAVAAKSTKQKAEKEAKPDKVPARKVLQRVDKDSTSQPTERTSKAEKAAHEAVKAASKQAATLIAKSAAARSAPSPAAAGKDAMVSAPERKRERERGNVSAAAKIVQRDLGLSPGAGRRRGAKAGAVDGEAAKGDQTRDSAVAPSEVSKKDAVSTKPTEGGPSAAPTTKGTKASPSQPGGETPSAQGRPEAASVTSAKTASQPTKPAKAPRGKAGSTAALATSSTTTTSAPSTGTQAFLKHANPSQGVTEPLLEAAFSPFGTVLKVEIDRKKGFGYVDFAAPEGLQKAIAASPVTVGQSQVVVLERKLNPSADRPRAKGRAEVPVSNGTDSPAAAATSTSHHRGGKPVSAGDGTAASGTPTGPRGRGSRGRNRGAAGGGKGSAAEAGGKAQVNGSK